MSARGMMNIAHAALVEEFQRPLVSQGITVPGLSLMDALKAARPWAEGYDGSEDEEQEEAEEEVAQTREDPPKMTEEEIVAQNERGLAAIQSRMGGMGGFFKSG